MAEDKKNVQGKQAPVMDINEQMQNRIDKMHKLEERGFAATVKPALSICRTAPGKSSFTLAKTFWEKIITP